MSHKLYDITLYYYPESYSAKDFTFRQNLVSGLYVTFLDNYKPKGTTRISVTLGNKEYIVGYGGSSILSVYGYFNETAYWVSTPNGQNQIILDTVHRIAMLCAEKYNWDKSVFEIAYQKVIASDFVYRQEQKRKFSPDKKHRAALLIEKDGMSATISVQFYNVLGDFIKSDELLKSYHDEWFYGNIIKNNKWFNNREFGIYTKREELIIKASLDFEKSQTIITPGKNTLEDLEGYLKRIIYAGYVDESDVVE
jgi:hypothetical protein